MKLTTISELAPWRDPDELLDALYRVSRDMQPELRDAIFRLMDHSDADVREEAIRILITRWKDRDALPKAFVALRSDPIPTVRSAAAFAIGASGDAATRRTHTQQLLDVLHNPDEDVEVRAAAYDALLILHRKTSPVGGWPFPSTAKDFVPERDVDWAWLNDLKAL